MDAIKVDFLSTVSHSWNYHDDSWLLMRALKTAGNAIKAAVFQGYTINVNDSKTLKILNEKQDAWCSQALRKELTAFNIDFVKAADQLPEYIGGKLKKLVASGRELTCQLAIGSDRVSLIPVYYSRNQPTEDLSGKVTNPESGRVVKGCDLAQGHAEGVFGRGKSTFSNVQTAQSLQAFSPNLPDHDALKSGVSAEAYYFAQGNMSEALERIASKYWALDSGENKSFLFNIGSDVMALRIKKRPDCLKIIFYDPVDSSRHETLLLSGSEQARSLTIKNFLSRAVHSDSPLLSVGSEKAGVITALERQSNLSECAVCSFGKLEPEMVQAAMKHGHFGHSAISRQRFQSMRDQLSQQDWFSMLQAEDKLHATGLYNACCRNNHQAACEMIQLMSASISDSWELKMLLSGKLVTRSMFDAGRVMASKTGSGLVSLLPAYIAAHQRADRSCLDVAIANNNPDTAYALMNAITSSRTLSPEHRKELLQNPGGESVLFSLLRQQTRGEDQMCEMITGAVTRSNMPFDQKLALIQSSNSEGKTFLQVALDSGRWDLIRPYYYAVNNSPLTYPQKVQLIGNAAA